MPSWAEVAGFPALTPGLCLPQRQALCFPSSPPQILRVTWQRDPVQPASQAQAAPVEQEPCRHVPAVQTPQGCVPQAREAAGAAAAGHRELAAAAPVSTATHLTVRLCEPPPPQVTLQACQSPVRQAWAVQAPVLHSVVRAAGSVQGPLTQVALRLASPPPHAASHPLQGP